MVAPRLQSHSCAVLPACPAPARPHAGRRAARLLLARDVRPTGDERPECGYLVTRRHRADLLDAGLVMAAADRLPRGRGAYRRVRIRLLARIVPRRPIRGVRTLCTRRDRARALGP